MNKNMRKYRKILILSIIILLILNLVCYKHPHLLDAIIYAF